MNKEELVIYKEKAERILEADEKQRVMGCPALPQGKVNEFYQKVYKPWRLKYDEIAKDSTIIHLVKTTDEEYITECLNVPVDKQYQIMINHLMDYKKALEEAIESKK